MDNIFSSILTAVATFLALHFTFQRDRDNRIYDKIEKKADQTALDKLADKMDGRMEQMENRIMERLNKQDEKMDQINAILRRRK